MTLVDLSHFFNKFILYIPSDHIVLTIRVTFWGFLGCISIREFYLFVTEQNIKRLGLFVWMSHLILAIEYFILYKFMDGNFNYFLKFIDLFKKPFPDYIKFLWIGICGLYLIMLIMAVSKDFKKYK